mmetsp:Transcript_4754/g.6801  ORF Transcript_4754/g.6801 Transcript_4754/m.6801 type:complete len:105 (+) Transcript_4754:290-604(+)
MDSVPSSSWSYGSDVHVETSPLHLAEMIVFALTDHGDIEGSSSFGADGVDLLQLLWDSVSMSVVLADDRVVSSPFMMKLSPAGNSSTSLELFDNSLAKTSLLGT